MIKPTCVYRYYNANNILLYIGVSAKFLTRLMQHRSYSDWFRQANLIKMQWFSSRAEATREEKNAIINEKPKYNKTHNKIDNNNKERYPLAFTKRQIFFLKEKSKQENTSVSKVIRRLVDEDIDKK